MRRTIAPLAFLGALLLAGVAPAGAESGRTFSSPEEAGGALITALAANDDQALLGIFGSDAADVVQTSKDPLVAESRKDLAVSGKEKLAVERSEPGHATLLFGDDGWPLPIPLVEENGAWRFDLAAGKEELLARRIGSDELRAIRICDAYVDAQVDYASEDRDGDGVREYAQRLISTPGTRDGLYWPNPDGDDPSPIDVELGSVARPEAEEPYGGYRWKILTAQGEHAPGGAYSYVINGNMIAGFALVGTPAAYRKTGVMTFIVSNHGAVYQKDLGEQSPEIARAMTAFDPDPGWTKVDEVGGEDDGA